MSPASTRIACRAVVTDIEGTTSTIAFVKEVLFPYADERLDAYVAAHRNEPAVAQAMLDAAREADQPPDADDATVLAYLHRWMGEDRKSTPLKALQGLIWKEGYERTGLRGHLYGDAAAALRAWHADGIAVYVYSSGSVEAQKVLFGHSDHGDFAPLISGYFDTTTGPKRERASYETIARAIGFPPAAILFLSDVDAELDAARSAGMQTVRLMRPRDTPPGATTTHTCVSSFDQLEVSRPA